VAEAFFEQIRIDLERKTEQALSGADLWTNQTEMPGQNAVIKIKNPKGVNKQIITIFGFSKLSAFNFLHYTIALQSLLTGCIRVFELCEEIDGYITNMEPYALRFVLKKN
jgi:hypothetical protein